MGGWVAGTAPPRGPTLSPPPRHIDHGPPPRLAGQPPPYHLTRHSAGHVLLRAIAAQLAVGKPLLPMPLSTPTLPSQPQSQSQSHPHSPCQSQPHVDPPALQSQLAAVEALLATPLDAAQTFPLPRSRAPVTLYESSSLMNVSGRNVQRKFRRWLDRQRLQPHYRSRAAQPANSSNGHVNANSHANGMDRHSSSAPETPVDVSGRSGRSGRGNGDGGRGRLGNRDTAPSQSQRENTVDADTDRDPPLHTLRLLVLHDDLDLDPGKLRIRRGGAGMSVRGHNGLKSVVHELVRNGFLAKPSPPPSPQSPTLVRIGLGIGRPGDTRRPREIADHVLGRLSPFELVQLLRLTDHVVRFLDAEAEAAGMTPDV
ncbi:aminoacyl-tRNA hydrolase [Ascosphaera acerosa]|nr:aminoacyl-tRNA hydrolase [Ascosphaera acerosa]